MARRAHALLGLALAATVAGCGVDAGGLAGLGTAPPPEASGDGGGTPDATFSVDASRPQDAHVGDAPAPDAGLAADGSLDASAAMDGTAMMDSGAPVDSSTSLDSSDDGGSADSGAPADATADSAPPDDASSAFDAPVDAADDAPPVADASPDGASPADGGPCDADGSACVTVPPGWSLVAFATTQSSTCPSGFAKHPPTDVVAGPGTANACSCGSCNVTADPSCDAGPIDVFFDTHTAGTPGTCSQPGSVTPLSNSPAGACLTDIYQGAYSLYDLEYVPPPASGGTCSASAVAQVGKVTFSERDRSCTPDSAQAAGCSGATCSPTLPPAYRACIASPGSVACPPGPLSDQHVVGNTVSFDCSTCSCSVTADCSGTLDIYPSMGCGGSAITVPVDGACHPPPTSSPATYRSYRYSANSPQNVACQSGSSTAQNVSLVSATTICCAP